MLVPPACVLKWFLGHPNIVHFFYFCTFFFYFCTFFWNFGHFFPGILDNTDTPPIIATFLPSGPSWLHDNDAHLGQLKMPYKSYNQSSCISRRQARNYLALDYRKRNMRTKPYWWSFTLRGPTSRPALSSLWSCELRSHVKYIPESWKNEWGATIMARANFLTTVQADPKVENFWYSYITLSYC